MDSWIPSLYVCVSLQILGGTVWDGDLETVKTERNKLYEPLTLEPPVVTVSASEEGKSKSKESEDTISYQTLLNDFARGM